MANNLKRLDSYLVCCGKQFFVLRDGIPRSKQDRHPFAHFVFGRVGDEYLFVDGRIVRQVEIDIATRKFRIRRKGERGVYDPHVLCQPRYPVFLPAGQDILYRRCKLFVQG